jgi:hypothetical protein
MSSREETTEDAELEKYFKQPQIIKYVQVLNEQLFGKQKLDDSEDGFIRFVLNPTRTREIRGIAYSERDKQGKLILDEPPVNAIIKRLDMDNTFYSLAEYFANHSNTPSTTEDLLMNLKRVKTKAIESLEFTHMKKIIMGNYINSEALLATIKRMCDDIKRAQDDQCIFDIYFEVLFYCYETILIHLKRETELEEMRIAIKVGSMYKINVDYKLDNAVKTRIRTIIGDAIKDRDRQLETSSRMLFGGKRKRRKTKKFRQSKRRKTKRRKTIR